MRIALFTTCLVDGLFPHAAAATVRLLERLGHEVVVPPGQACCGQMHVNSGYPAQAEPVVRNHVRAFWPVVAGEWDAVVAPSGSCVGSTRHQQARVARQAGDERLAVAAERVAARTYELSELLVDVLGVTDVGAWFPHTVTYHPTCHSLRMLRVGDRPTRLLGQVDGLRLVDLPDADQCCGFGGTFALKNSATSVAMVSDKADCVQASGAEVVTAGDWSCLMNIDGALSRRGAGVRAVHLAEILAATRGEPWRPPGTRPAAARSAS
ncbi:(Fe-S)-binding protein [Cellulomonas cellasea]|uniref:Glycolate oxidase n=1 Tax=Cellulomonas cellasea TaxID=43670 RepID=A0A4Y3KYC7_9CELL|nr:(Fe-S)-binding protein [Cellulomonas cellasea]GEA88867.1 glycolate oxidase [Cellulomonas cellasea]